MKMQNKTYDILKFIAQIVLPGLGTLYFALAGIWGFPFGEQIVGTIAAIDAFLGAILGISSAQYYNSGADIDGVITIEGGAEDPSMMINVNDNIDLEDIAEKKQLKLSVDANNYVGKH